MVYTRTTRRERPAKKKIDLYIRLEGVEEHEVFVQAQESRVQPVERPAHLVEPLSLGVVRQPSRRIVNEKLLQQSPKEERTTQGVRDQTNKNETAPG